ncbi:MAG: hypothetical protein EOO61_01355 [Hymenobacter sp.]|nr:MAG: hypothetical protein EOO61_01355 [Hymenobacter sp.]
MKNNDLSATHMKPTITIYGLLTVSKSGEEILSDVETTLTIAEPGLTGYSHPWSLSKVKLPVAMAELNRIKELSFEDEESWFDVKFKDIESGHFFESKAFIHSLDSNQNVELQGAKPLPLHQHR